jgi:hypothetical protein
MTRGGAAIKSLKQPKRQDDRKAIRAILNGKKVKDSTPAKVVIGLRSQQDPRAGRHGGYRVFPLV